MRIAALALVSAAALVLAGCTGAAHPTSTPKPVPTPVFTSDAQALAAAEKAYRAYRSVAERVLADGGVHPERLDDVAAGKLLREEQAGDKEFRDKGYRARGESRLVSFALQRAASSPLPDSHDAVTAYVCLDVSAVDVVDASGKSVVSSTRSPKASYVVGFDLRGRAVLPISQEPWDSGGSCA